MVPKSFFLTKGVGRHKKELYSFENALREAGVAHLNLVETTPVLPPNCSEIDLKEASKRFYPGQIAYVVLARNSSRENHRLVNAAIGCAIPRNKKKHGYISRLTGFGKKYPKIKKEIEDLAVIMGISSQVNQTAEPNIKNDRLRTEGGNSKQIFEIKSSVCQAEVQKHGEYTTAVALAVFLF